MTRAYTRVRAALDADGLRLAVEQYPITVTFATTICRLSCSPSDRDDDSGLDLAADCVCPCMFLAFQYRREAHVERVCKPQPMLAGM